MRQYTVRLACARSRPLGHVSKSSDERNTRHPLALVSLDGMERAERGGENVRLN